MSFDLDPSHEDELKMKQAYRVFDMFYNFLNTMLLDRVFIEWDVKMYLPIKVKGFDTRFY